MKKINVLFIAFLLILSSCSSDDDNGQDVQASIVGTWEMEALNFSGTSSTVMLGQTITADIEGEAIDIDYSLVFSENPNEVVEDGDFSVSIDFTVLGQTTTQVTEDVVDLVPSTGGTTWSQSGTTLTLSNSENNEMFTILDLTETMLRLQLDIDQEVMQDGVTVDIDASGIIELSR